MLNCNKVNRFKLLHGVNRILLSALKDPDPTSVSSELHAICRLISENCHAEITWIISADLNNSQPVPSLLKSWPQGKRTTHALQRIAENKTVLEALLSPRSIQLQHIQNHSTPELQQWGVASCLSSLLTIPISDGDIFYGNLLIFTKDLHPDLSRDLDHFLADIASEIAIWLNAIQARHDLSRELKQLQRDKEAQQALREIIQLSLEPIPLADKMDQALEILFRVSWLDVQKKGSIFRADNQHKTLHFISKRHLSSDLQQRCNQLPYGECLCGLAAQRKEVIFHAHVNHEHSYKPAGMQDHGHYCLPIIHDEELLGVLNLYVDSGHTPLTDEQQFLKTVCNTLAGMLHVDSIHTKQNRLAAIVEKTPDGVVVCDSNMQLIFQNESARHYGVDSNRQRDFISLFPPQVWVQLQHSAIPSAIENGNWKGELTLVDWHGNDLPTVLTLMSQKSPSQPGPSHLSAIFHDIRYQKKAQHAALNAAVREQFFANQLINGLPGIFYLLDNESRLIRWNKNLEHATGYSPQELMLMPHMDLFNSSDHDNVNQAVLQARNNRNTSFEVEIITKSGRIIPFFINDLLIESIKGAELSMAGVGIDISYRKELELELKRRATTDSLTGIANRSRIEEFLEHQIRQGERYHSPFSIILIDIDHFKKVNDTYGHEVGDLVLKAVVNLVKLNIREADVLARWGGEEFVILVPSLELEAASKVAEKVRLSLYGHHIPKAARVTASFGVAQFYPGANIRDLVKNADTALYHSKDSGRNCVSYWYEERPVLLNT